MNDPDSTSLRDEAPQVPDHLRAALSSAAREELEFASDGSWPDDEDEYAARLDRVTQAVDALKNWKAGTCTRNQIAKLTTVAIGEQEPARWPLTIKEADDVIGRATLTRDLILLRDALGGKPRQEELDG